MIDNFDVIPFEFVEGEFYFIQIILRGKDSNRKLNGNNHQRCIKTYSIYTQEQLEEKKKEMIDIATVMGARIYIHPARRSRKEIALELLSYVADCIRTNTMMGLSKCYETVVGKNKGTERIWIVDIDFSPAVRPNNYIVLIGYREEKMENPKHKYPIIATIPTKNGIHLLTHPFNVAKFPFDFDIHKNNPTILYIPNMQQDGDTEGAT